MSVEYPTLAEVNAYDRGFAEAEDYWRPKEQDRIAELLDSLIADDFIGIFRHDGNVVHYSKSDFIALVNGESNEQL